MIYETDERLKAFLDNNQLARERLCLVVLATDKRFSNVQPRHPRGGPDGARDIEATFLNSQVAFGAVGFLNQADDSAQQRRRSIAKFHEDIERALTEVPTVKVFVCFTNVNLTITQKTNLAAFAKNRGIIHLEVFDRERIRVVLDSSDGFAARIQYLGIPLSDAEQATFFGKWGDDIQGLISNGFGKLEKTLNRLQFLAETTLPFHDFIVFLELDREYLGSEIGHFRAFCSLELKEPKHGIAGFVFGTTDNPDRNDATSARDLNLEMAGLEKGRCGRQWERRLRDGISVPDPFADEGTTYLSKAGSFHGVGLSKVRGLTINFGYHGLFRVPPYFLLRDFDEASFALFLNRTLADKVKEMHVYGNEYQLARYLRESMRIDLPPGNFTMPMCFAEEELADEWVRVMFDLSPFTVSFSNKTPLRTFPAIEIDRK